MQEKDDCISMAAIINPIAWAEWQPYLKNAAPDRFGITKVTHFNPV